MTYAIGVNGGVPRITQSGVDTALAGIDTMITAVAAVVVLTPYVVGDIRKPPAANGMWYRCSTLGTTAAVAPLYDPVSGSATTDGTAVFTAFLAPVSNVAGDLRVYYFPEVDFDITGTLTIADPSKQTYTCRLLHTGPSCNYTSGTFATGIIPLTAGTHFTTCKTGPNNYAEQATWDGAWSIRGGTFVQASAVRPQGGAVQRFYSVRMVSSTNWGGSSIRWRSYSTDLQFFTCETYDIGIDAFNVPSQVSIKSFGSEYVSQYVGSQFGGTDAKMTISALSNQNGTFDFDNYSGGWVEIYDCAKGAALNVVCQQSVARHCVPLFQNLNFMVTNLAGAVQDGVRYTTTDAPVNSPTVTITTLGSLKTWDFRNPLTLTGITAGGGLASSVPCLKVWHGAANTQNLRYPASTASYRFCGYSVMQQDVPVVLGSDAPLTPRVAMVAATNLIVSEAAAAALTGIALVASGAAGGTATMTLTRTLSELWQYFRAWKPLNLASDDSWLFDGATLTIGGWTVAATLTTGGAYTYLGGTIATSLVVPTFTGGTANIGAAGTYTFSTSSTIVSMTPTVPSTYILNGTHGGTLSLKNAAAHAITVQIPLGTTFTTAANVGGVITVTNPPIFLQVLRPNIINASNYVIRNVTTATEIASGTTSGGTGINVTFTKGVHYNTSNVLEIRIGYCVALDAKLPIIELLTAPALDAVNSAPTVQTAYDVYNGMGINGSAQTQFAADYAGFDVNVLLGTDFLGQNFMAWWVYNESTLQGLRQFLGLYTLIDAANIRNNTGTAIIQFDNTTVTHIKQIDNVRIFRSDAGYPVKIPSTGGGAIDINWRNPVLVTGVTDPWGITLPGAYAAGTAGNILGNDVPAIKTLAGLIPAAL